MHSAISKFATYHLGGFYAAQCILCAPAMQFIVFGYSIYYILYRIITCVTMHKQVQRTQIRKEYSLVHGVINYMIKRLYSWWLLFFTDNLTEKICSDDDTV